MKTLLTHWTLSAHPAMHRVTQATNDERTAHETRATNARSRCTGTQDTQHGAFEIVSKYVPSGTLGEVRPQGHGSFWAGQ